MSTPTTSAARFLRTFALLLIVAAVPATLAVPAGAGELRWRSGTVLLPGKDGGELAVALDELARRPAERHFVVQFRAPLGADDRAAVAAAGIELLRPLGDHAFFAALDGAADARGAAALGLIDDVTEIDPAWKIDPFLLDGGIPTWAIVPPDEQAVAAGATAPDPLNPVVGLYVLLHTDVALMPDGWGIVALAGGRVRSELRSVNGLVVELPLLNVPLLAAEDAVQHIEPALPKFRELNNSNRARVGADIVHTPPYGLDGSGVSVLVYDGGFALASHGDFGGRLTVRDTAGISDHATHVSGTVGGSGAGSSGQYRGMAPGVTIESYGFEQEGGLSQGFLYTDPGDLEDDYDEAINVYGVHISNNSIGTNTAPNGYPCEWEGNYGVTSSLIDAIVGGSLGAPFRIVWANGNERQGSAPCGAAFHTTAPPACAKNHITVGAINSNDDSMTGFSSWGPADDGRIKPDLSAPGCQSDDDNDVTSTSSSGGYNGKCGTSMAAPTVTGIGALILQDYRAHYPDRADFRNSTLKALLANSAVDVGNPGPDYQFGYGSVRVVPAIDHVRAGQFFEAAVDQGESYAFLVAVNPGDGPLKVTLAWDDAPGTPNVDPVLVNDLDLRVFDPDDVQHFPWTLDPADPGAPAVRNTEDRVNNIEQVVIDTPAPGIYRVEVYGFDVAVGPQVFSVAAAPSLINCSSSGVSSLDRTRYACESSATLRVVDCDLNTDETTVQTVSVVISSTSEPAGETILLAETSAETSAFEAPVVLSTTDAPGVLLIADGDVITITYVDADDGAGGTNVQVIDEAIVDCQAPSVQSIETIEVEPRSAIVEVITDEPVQALVHFGTSCEATTTTAAAIGLGTGQTIALNELVDHTTYFYRVEIIDQAGNTVIDDNGGACYEFTTPQIPDFFTESHSGDNDLAGQTVTFTPNGKFDFYASCATAADALPTDPAGGTTIPLTDDDSEPVSVGNGETVSLYGADWSIFYVGSNGYITFGGSDTDHTESLGDHFERPRISGLFDDLNPNSSGSVSWMQLGDRIAVTWLDVPEYNTSNDNTFQIELFFNGTIRMTWLQIDAGDGISGLSEGNGLSGDYYETDLSSVGGCGPRPPLAVDASYQTAINQPMLIELSASDDGQPDPPAALTFAITALPGQALRDAGNGTFITAGSLPYTLSGGGSTVEYLPAGGFSGADGFTFIADDGGDAPDGGPSDPGVIDITVGGPEAMHVFTMDSDPGWSTMGAWAFGTPTGGGTHGGDPVGGFSGPSIYGYNLAGDYPNNLSSVQYLTTGVIDCSQIAATELRFRRWLGIESASFDHANIQVSGDGSSWTTVWNHTGGSFNDGAWTLQSYDISAVADRSSTVFIRWGMGITDGGVTYPGWNIDDVEIWGVSTIDPPLLGDIDDDGDVDVDDLLTIITSWGVCDGCPADVNGDGVVDADDLVLIIVNWTTQPLHQLAGGDRPVVASAAGADETTTAQAPADAAAAPLFVNDGWLAPLDHGGALSIDSDYLQTTEGTLAIDIAGTTPIDEHDLLVVTGTAELGGTLDVRFDEAFEARAGDRFTVMIGGRVLRGFEFSRVQNLDDALEHTLIYDRNRAVLAIVDPLDPAEAAEAPIAAAHRRADASRADLTGDGVVDIHDIDRLLESWAAETLEGDVDGDGVVNGRDLVEVLSVWGVR